jgi:hypothetical protein
MLGSDLGDRLGEIVVHQNKCRHYLSSEIVRGSEFDARREAS